MFSNLLNPKGSQKPKGGVTPSSYVWRMCHAVWFLVSGNKYLFGSIWTYLDYFCRFSKNSVTFAQQHFEFLQGVWYLAKATTHSSKIKILWQTKFLNVCFPCLCCCCGMIWPTQWALYRWEKMLCNQNNEITKTYSNHLKSMSLNPAVCVHRGNLHSAESIVNICTYWTYVNTRQCKNLQNTPVGSSSYHW